MADSYRQVMDRVRLSGEDRARILAAAREEAARPVRRVVFPRRVRRYAVLAACFAVMAAAAVAAPRLLAGQTMEADLSAAAAMEALPSRSALEQAVGFAVPEVEALPFSAEETDYVSVFGEVAEVTFRDESHTAVLRKGVDPDPSGNYSAYPDVRQLTVGGTAVTCKGADGTVALAVWEGGGYGFSLSFDPAVPEEEALSAVAAILNGASGT